MSFVSAVPVQMTDFVASLTLDSAKSCVMQGASCTQRKVSSLSFVFSIPFAFSIPFVLSWGGSISPDSCLSSILLLVVMVVIIVVTVILVVVVAIIGVVIVVTIIGVVVVVIVNGVPSIIKLSFVIVGQEPFLFSPGDLVGLLYSNRFSIGIPPGQGIFGESTSSKFYFAVLAVVSHGSGFLFVLLVFAMLAACASRAAATLSATSCQMAA
ncbi:hypothetical protein Tco_0028186 [Tanacetum coccineum]